MARGLAFKPLIGNEKYDGRLTSPAVISAFDQGSVRTVLTLPDVRRAQARDVGDLSEYFEFVCNTCHSILFTSTFRPAAHSGLGSVRAAVLAITPMAFVFRSPWHEQPKSVGFRPLAFA
jgi:hypothetical protein